MVTVGVGSQNAGAGSRDVAVREITAGPTVFVKNKLEVRGALSARGYAGQQLDVELYVEGQSAPAAKTRVAAINQRLAGLFVTFSEHLLADEAFVGQLRHVSKDSTMPGFGSAARA